MWGTLMCAKQNTYVFCYLCKQRTPPPPVSGYIVDTYLLTLPFTLVDKYSCQTML